MADRGVEVKPKVAFLLSYAYFKPPILALIAQYAAEGHDIIIDCGAFTAYHTGRVFTTNGYAMALAQLPFKPVMAFHLDVVGKARETWRNYEEMMEMGAPVNFVYQRGAPVEDAYKALDRQQHIAVGGLGGSNRKDAYLTWLQTKLPFDRCHLLGIAKPWQLAKWRPLSADATTWMNGSLWGEMALYHGQGQFTRVYRSSWSTAKKRPVVQRGLQRNGIAMQQMEMRESWSGKDGRAALVTARSYALFGHDLSAIGTRLALVVTSVDNATRAKQACDWAQAQEFHLQPATA